MLQTGRGHFKCDLQAPSPTRHVAIQHHERSRASVLWTSLNSSMATESVQMFRCRPHVMQKACLLCHEGRANSAYLEFAVLIALCMEKCAEVANRLGSGDCK